MSEGVHSTENISYERLESLKLMVAAGEIPTIEEIDELIDDIRVASGKMPALPGLYRDTASDIHYLENLVRMLYDDPLS
ncbi:MAG TPA: hypothetical protein VGA08_02010 [Candidatus Saccharimonadales bacterium]